MGHDYRRGSQHPGVSTNVTGSIGTPGKRTLTEALPTNVAPVQRKATEATSDDHVHAAAQRGVADGGSPLPHLDVIQRAFGGHDVSGIQAHTGDAAARASTEIGAQAYATGNHVAFAGVPDLRTTAHEAAHVVQQRAGVQLKGGVGETGDAYERNADEVAERVVRGESATDLLPGGESSPGSPVQRSETGESILRRDDEQGLRAPSGSESANGPVQRKSYGIPSDTAIAAAMTAAGITDFGPYEWNDDNPKAKMFKLKSGISWTLADCVSRPIYQPEDPTKLVADEKAKHTLVNQRVRAARIALFGQARGVIDKIMEHDDGKTPRRCISLAAEDAASGGHIVERHILGQGLMTGHEQVALRAAFWKVNGVRMDLDPAGTATVFESDAVALAATQAALIAELSANWATHRVSLAKGTQVKITHAIAVKTVAYTKKDAPVGTPYPETMMPKYIDNAKSGDRELYSHHYTGPGRSSNPNAPDTSKDPLTTRGAATMGSVFLIVDPNQDAEGGWAVYTTYPK